MSTESSTTGDYPTKIGVACVVKRGDKILLGKRLASLGLGCWAFPGGHLEPDETPFDCALRETLEETGLLVTRPEVLSWTYGRFEEKQCNYLTLFVEAHYTQGEAKAMEPDKCEAWFWYAKDKLPSPIFETINALKPLGFREASVEEILDGAISGHGL